ncbi:MAG: hypothetical protein V4538_10510 [Bacteroidota bacterium]
MKRKLLIAIMALGSVSLVLSSCKKDKENDFDTESTVDNSNSESSFDQVFKQVDEAASSKALGKTGPTVTIDSSSSPKVMTIDYGTGTICNDLKVRSGKIIVTYTGRYRETGTVIHVTFENFVQNGKRINNASTKTITNNGRNGQGNLSWTIQVNASILLETGQTITWNSTRSRTWIAGESTPADWTDDKYEITGSTTGTNRRGVNYTCNITSPLLIDLSCNLRRITKGIVELTPEGKNARTIDFGNGECDNEATCNVNGRSFKIGKF